MVNYSAKKDEANVAKAKGLNLPISLKYSIEICNYIRGDKIARAKAKLEAAIAKEKAIPFKRFTDGVGHKPGTDIVSGRFAVKACTEILKLLNSAESNAVFKNLNKENLVISHIAANQSPQSWHHGRQRRRRVKKCHVEIMLEEASVKTKDVKKSKVTKTEDSKSEANVKTESKEEAKETKKTETKKVESEEVKEKKTEEKKTNVEAKAEESKDSQDIKNSEKEVSKESENSEETKSTEDKK